MAQDPNATNTPVQPSADRDADQLVGNESVGQSIDDIAMDLAKRGKDRLRQDEEGHSLFTK